MRWLGYIAAPNGIDFAGLSLAFIRALSQLEDNKESSVKVGEGWGDARYVAVMKRPDSWIAMMEDEGQR